MVSRLRTAISFLTILPVGQTAGMNGCFLARTAAFFPLVGWLLGGLLAAAAWLLWRLALTPLLSAVLVVILHVWLTRALHLDGLADLFDGLGANGGPEQRLKVMKDSATGVFGATGLGLLLILKVACLSVLLADQPGLNLLLLAAGPVAGRFAMAALAYRSFYPRQAGTGQVFIGNIRSLDLCMAGFSILPVLLAGRQGFAAILAGQLPGLWLRRKARLALGGVTGDVLGAACEMGEACAWLAAVVCLRSCA